MSSQSKRFMKKKASKVTLKTHEKNHETGNFGGVVQQEVVDGLNTRSATIKNRG